jgi:hypothetical protein
LTFCSPTFWTSTKKRRAPWTSIKTHYRRWWPLRRRTACSWAGSTRSARSRCGCPPPRPGAAHSRTRSGVSGLGQIHQHQIEIKL